MHLCVIQILYHGDTELELMGEMLENEQSWLSVRMAACAHLPQTDWDLGGHIHSMCSSAVPGMQVIPCVCIQPCEHMLSFLS